VDGQPTVTIGIIVLSLTVGRDATEASETRDKSQADSRKVQFKIRYTVHCIHVAQHPTSQPTSSGQELSILVSTLHTWTPRTKDETNAHGTICYVRHY